LAFALKNLGSLAMFQREYQRAIGLFEESLALYRAAGDHLYSGILQYFLARAMLGQGELARARVLLEEVLVSARQMTGKWQIAIVLSLLGQIALLQGEMERAEAFLNDSIKLSQEMGDRRSIARTRLLLASLAQNQGNLALARIQYEEGLVIAIELEVDGSIAFGLNGLGCVAAAQGQYTWSALLWAAADTFPESRSVPIPNAITKRARAAARSHLGVPAFEEAMANGRALTPAQALAAYKAFPMKTGLRAHRSPTYPAGLTAREVEILRLVAEGLTDAQVAEHLIMSVRTVNSHLTSIYNKLGVSSRAAATRFAVECHLV
jgi:DNA-binding CsgD family transcriptional regulator